MKWILPFLFFVSSTCLAAGLDEHLDKLRSVVQKDGRCDFAVVSIPKGKNKDNPIFWPKRAVCVSTLYLDKGTLKQRHGCMAFLFDANRLDSFPLLQGYDFNMAVDKPCEEGGLEAVMSDLLFTDNTAGLDKPGRRVPVSYAFVSPYRLPDSQFDVVKLYGAQSKMDSFLGKKSIFDSWFEKARNEFLEQEKRGKK